MHNHSPTWSLATGAYTTIAACEDRLSFLERGMETASDRVWQMMDEEARQVEARKSELELAERKLRRAA